MEKFIPYEKLSKKKKRERDAGKRTVWAISPVTRKSENPKAYNRRKAQKRMEEPGSVLSLFIQLCLRAVTYTSCITHDRVQRTRNEKNSFP